MNYLNSVETVIEVDGKPCDFLYLHLSQSMTDHHRFEIGVNYNHHRSSAWVETPQKIFEWLAKRVYIRMKHTQSGEETEFFGIVSDIDIVGREGDQGVVVLKGGSPTVLLDRDPAMGAFTDYTLHNIVGETLEKSGVKMEVQNKPAFDSQIPYVARYKESSYAFLARVLSSFGEWFYYDGQKLIVGNPQLMKNKYLFYDMEMTSVKVSTGVRNLNIRLYDYNPLENNYMENFPPQDIDGNHFFMRIARKQFDPFYPTEAMLPTNRSILWEKDMIRTVRAYHSRNYSKLLVMEGKTTTCGIHLGEFATVIVPKSFEGVVEPDLGRYRMIEIHHHVERDGSYYNTFKGIVGLTEALPTDHIVLPVAFPEPATVVDNEDPNKQGRVKVRYYWQNKNDHLATTNWIRVQSPDAGSSDQASTNRGLWFIPEKGDQVMIGFEQGDPSRPYVMGSMFHRDNARGIAKDNTIRSIVTKSGHILEFNDEESGGGITLKDRNGNVLRLDTSGKNIEITAPETITMHAKNININAEESVVSHGKSINMMAEKQLECIAGDECRISSKHIHTDASEDSVHTAKSYEATAEKVRIDSNKENLELASGKEVDLQSTKKVKLF